MNNKVPVSVLILTKNEEVLIERCVLASLWADEVLVLDSGSTDRTRDIARSLGASVYEQSWLGWVGQHDAAVALARNDWVVTVDADEIFTPELIESIRKVFETTPDPRVGYAVDRRDEFFSMIFPNMRRRSGRRAFIRMFNRCEGGYDKSNLIHERVICPGGSIELDGILLHWRSFLITEQLQRFLENSRLEADQMERDGVRAGVYRILGKPILRFLWCYVRCGGFRMGKAGLVHAMMVANAEFIRSAVLWERQSVERRIHPPESVWQPPARSTTPAAAAATTLATPAAVPARATVVEEG